METIRKIKVFKTYFKEFHIAQTSEVKEKIDYVLALAKYMCVIATQLIVHSRRMNGLQILIPVLTPSIKYSIPPHPQSLHVGHILSLRAHCSPPVCERYFCGESLPCTH